MTQHDNIIAFPDPAAEEQSSHHNASPCAATVIDLSNRRRMADSKFQTTTAQASADELTPGEVWDALNDGRLQLHYQPQYDMRTNKTVAAEALVRLMDLDGQLIYPDRFIDVVEQSDLIVPLGRAVIAQVCTDLATCRAEGLALRRDAINLSARQLNLDTTLLAFIDQTITQHGLQHDDLEFELTERQSLSPDCAGIALLCALAERGARVVIDDFGIGFSSVVYLTQLPISAFKLDRALVSRLPEDPAMRSVVKNLLSLATDLTLEVIAEGIETRAQNEFLVRAGCPYAQGFGDAKPMPIDSLQVLLANNATAVECRFGDDVGG